MNTFSIKKLFINNKCFDLAEFSFYVKVVSSALILCDCNMLMMGMLERQ